jgi:predicted Zn-dependent protease
MQQHFHRLADELIRHLDGHETLTLSFRGEESDFVRFNHAEIRQAGTVVQRRLGLDLIRGRRHAGASSTLSGEWETDRACLLGVLSELRERLPHLPEDPYLLYATEVRSSERHVEGPRPQTEAAVSDIQRHGRGHDLVGVYAAGGIHAGFANSLGQRNWFSSHSFHFDWSLYHATDKAVKSAYAGFAWDEEAFQAKVALAARQLEALQRDPVRIRPGPYRVYLAPAALEDVVGLLSWDGFGLKAHKTRRSPLLKLATGEARLDARLTLRENTAEGIAPDFQADGFIRPPVVPLVEGGAFAGCLVSPRSAEEYGVQTNGAADDEAPESVEVSAGGLPMDDALARLGRGVYVGNLHYLNYSDRPACRTTGMTRFATFWVEEGEIQAPLEVMRFDDTVYRMLGENLIDLTAEREMRLASGTYGQRSTASARLPGALVEDFRFTL